MTNSYSLGDSKMPSQKPRIALTVDNDLNDVLEELARLTKAPKSTIVVNMLKDAKPHLQEIVNALKLVEDKKNVMPVLSRLTALANEQAATVNSEMANLYRENSND